MTRHINRTADFTCLHCHFFVSSAEILSHVHNRNHCPYCLWSRHLDLYQPGDRLSACKSGMQPVGLAIKRTVNKYASRQSGELMVVHSCSECGSLSANRIAADDDHHRILQVYRSSLAFTTDDLAFIESGGVKMLGEQDWKLVHVRLFGEVAEFSLSSTSGEKTYTGLPNCW